MTKPAYPHRTPSRPEDFADEPTAKRDTPEALRDPLAAFITTKLPKAEIERLLQEKEKSGLRPAVSDDDITRFERRQRETLPAPPDSKPTATDASDR